MAKFFDFARFPGVLGAIDCTHIAVQSPGGNTPELYRNRKGYFSINVQAVCNATLEITDVVARYPGSVHDSTIFCASTLCGRFERGEITDAYLLGDAGYACKHYLLTPLAATTNVAEERYNRAQIRTRNVIERCFGVLKRRFPCLRMGLRVRVEKALVMIVSCAVLHNIAVQNGDTQPPDDSHLLVNRRAYEDVPVQLNANQPPNAGATAVRTSLINNHF